MRYKGFASQNAGRRDAAPPARSASATTPFISLFDARRTTGLGDLFARWIGDPRPGGRSVPKMFVSDLLTRDGARQAFLSSAAVVKSACQRGFCPAYTVIHGKVVKGQTIITNSSDPIGSHYSPNGSIITLKTGDADNDDVLAHELGHRRDHEWADDRVDGHQQVEEVEEALADMFAYDFDHDPVIGEDFSIDYPGDLKKTDKLRHLAAPGAYDIDGAPYPSTMSQYRCAPDTDQHINATILGHAYYLFADKVGHDVAGNVLTYIPVRAAARAELQRRRVLVREALTGALQQPRDRRGRVYSLPYSGGHRHPDPRRQGLRLRTAAQPAEPSVGPGLREAEPSPVVLPRATDAPRARPHRIDQQPSPRGPRAEPGDHSTPSSIRAALPRRIQTRSLDENDEPIGPRFAECCFAREGAAVRDLP